MKVTYTFTDEEREELLTFQNALNFQIALCDMGNYLRAMARGKTMEIDDINAIYDRFFEILTDNNLNRDLVGF